MSEQQVNPFKQGEIIIRGDQAYSREVFEQSLGNIDQLIQDKLVQAKYEFQSLALPPMMRKWVKGHFLGMSPNKNHVLCFSEIEYIPLKGASLFHYLNEDEDLEDEFLHMIPTDDVEYATNFLNSQSADTMITPEFLKWQVPSGYRAFVLVPWSLLTKQIEAPYLFFLDKGTSEPLIPELPNIYENGKICTGDSYGNRNDDSVRSTDNAPLHHIKNALDILHEAPVNRDLWEQSASDNAMIWSADEKQQEPLSVRRFLTTAFDERLVEFAQWWKDTSTKILEPED